MNTAFATRLLFIIISATPLGATATDPTELPANARAQSGIIIGNMYGDVTHKSVKFWVGIKGDKTNYTPVINRITINGMDYAFDAKPLSGIRSHYHKGWRCTVKGLLPEMTYDYSIEIEGPDIVKYTATGIVTTFPEPRTKRTCKILVASCMKAHPIGNNNGSDVHQVGWAKAREEGVDMVLLLGDTHYANTYKRYVKWEYTEHQLAVANYQRILNDTPVYAIYDDHDFIDNNEVGCGPKYKSGKWQNGSYAVDIATSGRTYRRKAALNFRGLWPLPQNPSGDPEQGCFYKVTFGLLDVYMLDTRFFREPFDADLYKTIRKEEKRGLSLLGSNGKAYVKDGAKWRKSAVDIGNQQWEWLEREFANYRSDELSGNRVKVLCFGSTYDSSSTFGESMVYYHEEMKKLGALLKDHSNVIFFTGDIHRSLIKQHSTIVEYATIHEIISSGIGRSDNKNAGFVIVTLFPPDDTGALKNEAAIDLYRIVRPSTGNPTTEKTSTHTIKLKQE